MDHIINQLKTKEEAREFLDEIDLLIDSLFNIKSASFSNILDKSVSTGTAENLKKIFLKMGNNKGEIRDFLTNLKEKIDNLKVIKLTIAFEPSNDVIQNIHSWTKSNFGPETILEFIEDKTIMGGAIIDYDGFYKDYSLRKTIKETFEKRKEEIKSFIR